MSAPVSNPNSNTFRAEPFVNLTAELVSNGTGASGSNSRRASQVFSTADAGERDERDELMEDEDGDEERRNSGIPPSSMLSTFRRRTSSTAGNNNQNDSGRVSISSSSGHHAHAISDIQRASIASTTSSASSARRSSYDPNEPGVLEKIHTGQGKSKRKPISVQQWKHMTTFKIRPPTATEAASSSASATNTSVPTPISVDPFQQYSPPPLSTGSDHHHRKMEADTGFVFIPDSNSANAIPAAPPIPRAVPIVMPPATLTTNTSASASQSPPKPSRKRARREEPNDPNIQIFYHDDAAPAAVPVIRRTGSLDTPPTPPPPHHHPPLDPLDPLAPDMSTPAKVPTPPVISAAAAPRATSPIVAAPVVAPAALTTQPTTSSVKYDPTEQVFILSDLEPLERGGPPPKKWAPVYREMKTIGGGSWHATTWNSEGEPAVPIAPPPGFIPGLLHTGGMGFGASAGSALQGLSALSSLALGGSGLVGSATPTLGASGSLAAPKRVKKVKSDVSLNAGLAGGATVPATSGGRKKPAGTGAKRVKKGITEASTPAVMEPPLVAITRAISDTEMADA